VVPGKARCEKTRSLSFWSTQRPIQGVGSMFKVGNNIQLSASDLVGHLNCRNLTELDLAVAKGGLAKPRVWDDPLLDVARERGLRHEQGYIDHLRAKGLEVETLAGMDFNEAVAATANAMSLGRQVIVQGAFLADNWRGRPDVLLRVETPSSLGNWSYEVVDTKLSRETKGGTVLQLSLYSDLLGKAQGVTPQSFQVIVPWSEYQPQTFRTADFAAYYRRVRASLEQAVKLDQAIDVYPDPKPFCDVCRWQERCDAKRHADDHLSLVAGISKIQIAELGEHAVTSCAALAAMPIPLTFKPGRGSASALERVREQARIQAEGKAAGDVRCERLETIPGLGLAKLYEPSQGDIFLDLEGDPFVGDGGLEYLFGYSFRDEDGQERHVADWAFSPAEERAAFERFIDFVMNRLSLHPDLHIYHFAHYEPSALKRLMGRYATREDELDQLLRGKRFVDLLAVVRQGLRASVESYSIKRLEPLYGYARETSLPDANQALAQVQALLELGDASDIGDDERSAVKAYNRDDCKSTWRLRDWLENVRAIAISEGEIIARPSLSEGEPGQALTERQLKIAALVERLTLGVPDDPLARTAEQHARWILAHCLDFHRRERKVSWWEFFRLCDLPPEDILDERPGLGGLKFAKAVGGTARAPVHRYQFPPQETELRGGEHVCAAGGAKLGHVEDISIGDGWVDIKKRCDSAGLHPEALFAYNDVNTTVLADALLRIGEYVADHGLEGDGPYQAARDLLMRREPRVGGQPLRVEGETALAAARRLALALDGGVLPIQGPPGSGKTYTGARMITEMVNAGLRVGVTGNSHKVIRNLLDKVCQTAEKVGLDLTCIEKVQEAAVDEPRLRFTTDNATCLSALHDDCRVAGGTAWLWTRPDAIDAVDVLFVDEAAQRSLADVLAVSQAARTVVLLGDPQQLDQPMQGTHPNGVATSALNHMLGGEHRTISEDRGLFLDETWRLHPTICAFTSELFYEGRLHPRPGLEMQEIRSTSVLRGSGLRYLPAAHTGNQSSSPEEAEVVRALVSDFLASNPTWINREGLESPLTLANILIIAPYNAQVFELQTRLPGARIGTVDKFQGQEAPVVIYSMTTSSHADAPRGMEFLYSLNRLNVATSRAQCLCVLVASPMVFEADCRTPEQMRLANAYCRYLELAQQPTLPSLGESAAPSAFEDAA
jgi:predicted RecB family nuclease